MELDFSKVQIEYSKHYGGRNGKKICIVLDNIEYMIKYPARSKRNPNMIYNNDNYSEHIGCSIFKSLGLDVQDTFLIYDTHRDKVVVACKDLEQDGFAMKEFAFMKNANLEIETGGYNTELNDILNTINNQEILDKNDLTSYFWDMFVADAFIGNADRHNGNWGYLKNLNTKEIRLCPIYDCGSSLYARIEENGMREVLKDKREIEKRIYQFPFSQIKQDNKPIRYAQFLETTDNIDCLKSLEKISKRIDMSKVNDIIDNTPYMSDIHRLFIKTMIAERKTKIIDNALLNNTNISSN